MEQEQEQEQADRWDQMLSVVCQAPLETIVQGHIVPDSVPGTVADNLDCMHYGDPRMHMVAAAEDTAVDLDIHTAKAGCTAGRIAVHKDCSHFVEDNRYMVNRT